MTHDNPDPDRFADECDPPLSRADRDRLARFLEATLTAARGPMGDPEPAYLSDRFPEYDLERHTTDDDRPGNPDPSGLVVRRLR